MFPALLSCCAAVASDAPPPQSLAISADTPTVTIEPRSAGRGFVVLPTLEFRFRLTPACAAGWQTRAVTLGIADTRLTLEPGAADGDVLEALLSVPAAQLAPLPITGFCETVPETAESDARLTVAAAADSAPAALPVPGGELTVDAAVSAQAALLCASESGERLTFVARPLAITLICSGPPLKPAQGD